MLSKNGNHVTDGRGPLFYYPPPPVHHNACFCLWNTKADVV